MTTPSFDTTPLVSAAAIARASRAVIDNAMAGDFPIDPIIGPDLSKSLSVINSVVKRHGLMLQKSLADALAATGRFEVLTEVALPITEAANALLASQNSDRDLAKIKLKADSAILRMVTVDLIVVETEAGWAGVYDVKRGNGATESARRRPIEHGLKAARLVIADYLSKLGYEGIRNVTSAVIDVYGASGFSKDLKVTGDELDEHFGVPVLATLEAVTTELHRTLFAEMRGLLAPALANLPKVPTKTDVTVVASTWEGGPEAASEGSMVRILKARPSGPGPWRGRAV
jgi:hypothetical protein